MAEASLTYSENYTTSDKATAILSIWKANPALFVQQVFGARLSKWQAEALQAVARNDKIAIRSGHGVGKSVFLVWCIYWFLTVHDDAKVPCTAPTFHQLSDILWNEAAKWLRRMPEELRANFIWTADRITLGANREIFAVGRTARKEKPEAFQGFHARNMLFIGDEASGIDDLIFEVAEGVMSTPGAKVVLTGNPTRTSGYFFDCFHRMRHSWTLFKVSALDPGLLPEYTSPTYAKDVAERYGDNSNVYRVRVLGDFPKEEDDRLIALEDIEQAMMREVAQYGPIVWGVDPSYYGDDATTLMKRHGNHLPEPCKAWHNASTSQTAGRVIKEYRDTDPRMRPVAICVDVIGWGAGVYDALRDADMPAIAVNVAETAGVFPEYPRLRDQLWIAGVRDWFKQKDVVICKDEELHRELLSVWYDILPNGKMKAASKENIKKELRHSPDRADALMLTFATNRVTSPRDKRKTIAPNIGTMA